MRFPFLVLGTITAVSAFADPLSQSRAVDFYRDVTSRKLDGFATRSDGRLVAGPSVTPLTGDLPVDLIWAMAPAAKNHWWVGSGPDGQIWDVSFDLQAKSFQARETVKLADGQVLALAALPHDRLLAGTSPLGTLNLIDDGKVVAAVRLPVDSVLDLLSLPDDSVLVGTGNPGRIYRIDVKRFAKAGTATDAVATDDDLAKAGITEFGRIRDRNVRRLFREASGGILAGSAPGGRLYAFPAEGGEPEILFEQERGELTDMIIGPDGDLYAAVVIDTSSTTTRVTKPTLVKVEGDETEKPAEEANDSVPSFNGRSNLVRFPAGGGLPETVASRNNVAFYHLALEGALVLVSGGDNGELVGYDPVNRRSLTFAGSDAAQHLELQPFGAGRFLLLENNPVGFAIVDFHAQRARSAETRSVDLRDPATIGALRFDRMRDIAPNELSLSIRVNRSDDEREGWTPWTPLAWNEGGYVADTKLVGRYVQVRVKTTANVNASLELDHANLFHLPLNRRPQLQAFRLLSPNFGLRPRAESTPTSVVTLGQVIGSSRRRDDDEDKRANAALLASQVVPQPYAQIVHWTVDDADGDNLTATFSLRRDGEDTWQDIAVDSTEGYVQFDRRPWADGHYFTRLVIKEQAPRPVADRQQATFETDDLLIDNTPPTIEAVEANRGADSWRLTIRGRDVLSGLEGVELTFNNGWTSTLEQPADGILDQLAETFVTDIPTEHLVGATAVEVVLYDDAGNYASQRVLLPTK